MFAYVWPLGLIVISNILYQICAKSVPFGSDPFATLTITYAIAAVVSLILYFVLNKGGNIFNEYRKFNWAPFVMGIVIIGLEVGTIFSYMAGWKISTLSIVQSSILAVALIVIGFLFYKEHLTWNKIVGIVITLVGIFFINIKS